MGREVEGGLGVGTYVHPWRTHVDVWQNQYSIVKGKKKLIKKILKKKNKNSCYYQYYLLKFWDFWLMPLGKKQNQKA